MDAYYCKLLEHRTSLYVVLTFLDGQDQNVVHENSEVKEGVVNFNFHEKVLVAAFVGHLVYETMVILLISVMSDHMPYYFYKCRHKDKDPIPQQLISKPLVLRLLVLPHQPEHGGKYHELDHHLESREEDLE